MSDKVVLAYSGGVDTSVAIKWLQETYQMDVIAFSVDVGNEPDFPAIRKKALKLGAIKAIVKDAREPFVSEYVFPALQANAMYEGQYPLGTALGRPLIAKLLVDVALEEGAAAVAHGCTGKGNDQVRFDVSVGALAPQLKIIAPAREWTMNREQTIKYALEHDIPLPVTAKSPYSIDQNLWGRSIECGVMEDPWREPPDDAFIWAVAVEKAPDAPQYVEIGFERGLPVSVNGRTLAPLDLIERANQVAGKHGVGRIDHVEDRTVGIKSREIYEAPAAIMLIKAHQALEAMTLSKEQLRFKQIVSAEYANLVYTGQWFTSFRKDLSAFIESTQQYVTGAVRVKLFKGNCMVVGRRSPHSLYDHGLATYDRGDQFDRTAAVGFIKLWGLPARTEAQAHAESDAETPQTGKEGPVSQIRGRFRKPAAKLVSEYTQSLSFDRRLYKYDIEGSTAHARMLAKQGIISGEDASQIVKGLEDVRAEIEQGRFEFKPELEDIHMAIEARLIEKVGEAGRKLHTARSRNDQVALDIRLYAKDAIRATAEKITGLQGALVDLAQANRTVVMPGYTHLQVAQPVLFAHHMLAYFEMLDRDTERFAECFRRADVMPLGSGALAGVPYRIDRKLVAKELGFSGITANSIDAVADRDFVLEYESAASVCMMHLSRLAEELVVWSSAEFDLVELDEGYTTGSSIMPQKKNPDVAELARAKTGRVYGHLLGLLTTMKGLPLAYDRDLQEDKEGFFDTVDTLQETLAVFTGMIGTLRVKPEKMRGAAERGYILATDMADYLVKKGESFRRAHEVVGKLVSYASGTGKTLSQLDINEYRRYSALFGEDVYKITVESSLAARDVPGGTAPGRVDRALAAARKRLGKGAESKHGT